MASEPAKDQRISDSFWKDLKHDKEENSLSTRML